MKVRKETAESIRNFFSSGDADELTSKGKELLLEIVNIKNMARSEK